MADRLWPRALDGRSSCRFMADRPWPTVDFKRARQLPTDRRLFDWAIQAQRAELGVIPGDDGV